jgi:ABC-type glutathione transport system ATPase component
MMHGNPAIAAPDPLLKVENLVVEYPVGTRTIHAVSGVSLEIAAPNRAACCLTAPT